MIKWLFHPNRKKVTYKSIKNFLEAKLMYLRYWWKGESWILEQALWRLEQVKEKSPRCIEEGACINCGCEWKDKKHFEPEACELGCYPEWMNKQEWTQFKLNNYATTTNDASSN